MQPAREDVCRIEVPPLLTVEFSRALTDALAEAAANPVVRVVVFVGRDAGVFSRGLDLEAVVSGRIPADAGLAAVAECLKALHAFEKPKLAVVRGAAIGGGLGLAAACDWVLASEESTFSIPELLWGFVPAAILPLLIHRVGRVRAQAWALTAVARTAHEALAIGLVDEVVPDAQLDAVARRTTKLLLRPDPAAVTLLRSWTEEASALPIPEAIEKGAALTAAWLARSDVRARLEGFYEQHDTVPWRAS